VLYRQYRYQPEVFYKKLSDARNDNLEQLLERQLILLDFKVTFSQPERQAILDKEINKEVDEEIRAEIHSRYGGKRMSLIQTLQRRASPWSGIVSRFATGLSSAGCARRTSPPNSSSRLTGWRCITRRTVQDFKVDSEVKLRIDRAEVVPEKVDAGQD